MASLNAKSSVLSSSHAVPSVHAPSHDGLRSRSDSVLPQKLSFTEVAPLKSTVGERVTPLRASSTSLGQHPWSRNYPESWSNARQGHRNYAIRNFYFQHQTSTEVRTASTAQHHNSQALPKVVPVPERADPKPRVILIAGPTAVGKTRLSIELAKTLDGEIINADSVQVYQGLDVGAAKAPLSERQGIPHHLMDVVPPTREYSYTDYVVAARTATEEILSKGKVPIVAGGTGMYMRWYMHNRPNLTAQPFEGELESAQPFQGDYDFQCYFLYQHRADLYPRVDIRCEQMVPALLEETSWLMDLGVKPDSNSAARAIGYEEAMVLLLDARRNDGYISEQRLLHFLNEFQRNSKELVRKQVAWFRSENRSEARQFKWLAADASVAAMVECLTEEYRRAPGEVSGLSMGQDLKNASLLEQRRLKNYKAALRVYSDPAAVASTLAWIKNTQGVPSILADCGLVY